MPGDLERYLNDMIPGFRDRPNESTNDSLHGSETTESELEESRSAIQIANIKLEPIVLTDESSVDADVRTESSSMRNEMGQQGGIQQGEIQAIVIAEQTEMIDKLKGELRTSIEELNEVKEQLRRKNEESEAQRVRFEGLLHEAHSQLITKVKDAKDRLWCIDCKEMLEESPRNLCSVCRLFQ